MPLMQLHNEDCVPVMARTPLGSVDLLLTDPPYNLGKIGWDSRPDPAWEASMDAFLRETARVVRVGGAVIIFMSVIRLETVIRLAQKHRLYYKTTGIWHKRNPMPRNMRLHFVTSTEPWLYFVNRQRTGTFNHRDRPIHDFFECPAPSLRERRHGKHPTQKPLALMEFFIQTLTNPGDTVLDPFMGSGSTGVAAQALGRHFIGAEVEASYFEIAIKRMKD